MRYVVPLLFILLPFLGFNQTIKPRACASYYWDSLQRANNPIYLQSRSNFEKNLQTYLERAKKTSNKEIYRIPIAVHVIHNNSNDVIGGTSNSNISENQILSQIEVLNEDFRRKNKDTIKTSPNFTSIAADTHIEFCLASISPNGQFTNGITRHYSNELPFNHTSDNDKIKAFGYWPADQYLNIWITELSNDIIGYATFPSDVNLDGLNTYYTPLKNDGVVIDFRVFGRKTGTANQPGYDLGRTTTHEVGHWLGLFHIWGDQKNCSATDFCADTPNQHSPSTGCPIDAFSCTSEDITENYMDYSSDRCMNIFTLDQTERMRSAIEFSARRNALLHSLGCCTISKTSTLPLLEDFENNFDTTNLWTAEKDDFKIVSSPAINNYSFAFTPSSASTDTLHLTTPLIDMTLLNIPFMSFQSFDKGKDSKLRILYSLTCTDNWVLFNEITSFKKSEWCSFNLNLDKIKTSRAIRLRFEYITSENTLFYLDNINIHNESPSLEVSVYPNPTIGKTNLSFKYQGSQKKKVEIYSNIGILLITIHLEESYSVTHELDLSYLDAGLYILKFYVGAETSTKKIMILK
jgi:hypothetical protein